MKIVKVTWFDAQAGFGTPISTEELINEKPILTKSVGFLIDKNKERIILGFMQWDRDMWKHFQIIPIGMVKKIEELKGIDHTSKLVHELMQA